MEFLRTVVEVVLHLDSHLGALVADAGPWTYAVLALVVFCETGLVVTPFLPGDSLLFATGAVVALPASGLNVHAMAVILLASAVLGDTVNYTVGHRIGTRVATRFVRAEHLDRTRRFFERHGAMTVVLARFIPVVRTLTPFVAGMGAMRFPRFIGYCIGGGALWVGLLLYAGYFFGNIPAVKERFSLVILVVIGFSLLPVLIEMLRRRRSATTPAVAAERAAEAVVAVEVREAIRDARAEADEQG